MNTLLRKWSALVLLGFSVFMVSCTEDDPKIVVDPDGLELADGFYISAEGVDPVATNQLLAEQVDADSFGAQERDGFVANYVYLAAGDYNIVQIADRQIEATIGGEAETITDALSGCDFNDYTLVSSETDGAAFSVASAGLYKVSYESNLNEIVLYQIVSAGLIGDATAKGWGGDQIMEGTVSATGGEWSITDVVLRAGSYKVRFNCRWNIDRRTVTTSFDPANGYSMFTNFGGLEGNLEVLSPGNTGANIPIEGAAVGTYDFVLSWTPADGFSAVATRTGDAPAVTFVPGDHPWGIRGTAGIDWDTRVSFAYLKDGSTHKWFGVIKLGEGAFKVTDGGKWLGHGLVTDNTNGAFTGTDDFLVSAANAGFYFFYVSTSDDGVTYAASMAKASWGVIGDATPTGWDADTNMTESGSSFTVSLALNATGKYKFRANDDWAYNLGGALDALVPNGGDLSVPNAGTYLITLTTANKGETFTATVQ